MAQTASPTASKISMKLLVDTKAQRVLYAEAGKDIVDFLFSLLTLPVGTVVKILSTDSMVGSIGNLYGSVDKLDAAYILSDDAKNKLLVPTGGCDTGMLLQLPEALSPASSTELYRCSRCRYKECYDYVTEVSGTPCPLQSCRGKMTMMLKLVGSCNGSGGEAKAAPSDLACSGFVEGVVTYTVMDDLKVAPMSTISGITLLNTLRITDIGSLEEKTLQLGYIEGLEILKASLQSKKVLTDVFLGKKRKA